MKYGFNLEFNELDDNLQTEKIDALIEYNYENGNYEEELMNKGLDVLLEDRDIRDNAKHYIENHFPIYF